MIRKGLRHGTPSSTHARMKVKVRIKNSGDQPNKQMLRSRAEEELARSPIAVAEPTSEELNRSIHELQVHEIELEMQNEQLRQTQAELELARERYVELYDFAPAGYLTIDSDKGLIQEANLTSVSMLGIERSRLISKSFAHYVVAEDQDPYYRFWRAVFNEPHH